MTAIETDEGEARRKELYDEHRKQAWNDIQTSSDTYDRSLLTLSSGALAVSLAFIKDIVPLKQAVWMPLLYISWIAFAACIVVTVFSFRLSILAQKKQLPHLWAFYMERKQEYFDKKSHASTALAVATDLAGALFVVGLVSTVVFACKNLMRIRG
jgi:hypothetical protein